MTPTPSPSSMSSSPFVIPEPLVHALRAARSVTILTGAGISAESGIPTFRDSQTGLWAKYNPQELATPEAFAQNPTLVLNWYRWRCSIIEKAAPNPGHVALAEIERRVPGFTLVTQNVDGLHRQAGSQNVIELHGNIRRMRCSSSGCHFEQDHWPDEADDRSGEADYLSADFPICPRCGSLLRPDVVWFGEALPSAALENALHASQHCEIFLSVGTSGVVEPAASLSYEALRAGALVVEINPQPTPLTVYTKYYFPQPAGQVLPKIVAAAWDSETLIKKPKPS